MLSCRTMMSEPSCPDTQGCAVLLPRVEYYRQYPKLAKWRSRTPFTAALPLPKITQGHLKIGGGALTSPVKVTGFLQNWRFFHHGLLRTFHYRKKKTYHIRGLIAGLVLLLDVLYEGFTGFRDHVYTYMHNTHKPLRCHRDSI